MEKCVEDINLKPSIEERTLEMQEDKIIMDVTEIM
jgi:hypothetical protein